MPCRSPSIECVAEAKHRPLMPSGAAASERSTRSAPWVGHGDAFTMEGRDMTLLDSMDVDDSLACCEKDEDVACAGGVLRGDCDERVPRVRSAAALPMRVKIDGGDSRVDGDDASSALGCACLSLRKSRSICFLGCA